MDEKSRLGSRIVGGNSAYKRNESDFYPTPPEATVALLNFLELPAHTKIWEPACGEGHMVRAMEEQGYTVTGTDLLYGTDFLKAPAERCDWIITNPPFSLCEQFIRRCVFHKKPFALLTKAQYWNAKKRIALFTDSPPSHVLPLTWRPDFMFGKRGGGSPLLDVSWCVWATSTKCGDTRYFPLERPDNQFCIAGMERSASEATREVAMVGFQARERRGDDE